MAGFLDALSWLSVLLSSTCVLVLLCLVFGGAEWMDGEDTAEA